MKFIQPFDAFFPVCGWIIFPPSSLCATAWCERTGVSRWDDKTLQSHSVLPPHPVEKRLPLPMTSHCHGHIIVFLRRFTNRRHRMPVPVLDSCRRHGIPITPYKRNGVERRVGWRMWSSGGVPETRYCMATLWRVSGTRSRAPHSRKIPYLCQKFPLCERQRSSSYLQQ